MPKYLFWLLWRSWFYILVTSIILLLLPILLILTAHKSWYRALYWVIRHLWATPILYGPFVFVGKKELSRLPLFGYFYKRVAIMVDRKSPQSRREVYTQAMACIEAGLSICIFPEGGVPDDESIILDKFKDGAFRIAIECQIPIVPMVFYDAKKRFPFRFFAGSIGIMRVDILAPIYTQGKTLDDKDILREEVRTLILQHLTNNTH